MRLALLVASLSLVACIGSEHSLRKQAAFDEKCPEENVKVLRWGPAQRSAEVDACGKTLSYHAEVVGQTDTLPGSSNWVQVK